MIRIEKYYPPGYEWQEEWKAVGILMWMAFLLSLQYLFRLEQMTGRLYQYEDRVRIVRDGAVADSFAEVVGNGWQWFLLPIAFLVVMAAWHYASYWQHTKSIYVMRRLPKRGVVFLSCVQGPVLCVAVLSLGVALLYGLYLGIYWITVPAVCMPRLY